MDRTDDDNLGCGQCDDANNDYNTSKVDRMDDDNPSYGECDDATNDHIMMTLLAMGTKITKTNPAIKTISTEVGESFRRVTKP